MVVRPRSQTDLCFNFLTHTHQSPELAEEIIPQDVFVQKDCLGFIEETYIIILNSYTHRIKIGGRSLIFVPALLGLRTRGPIRGKRSAASTTNLILFLQSRLHLWWF